MTISWTKNLSARIGAVAAALLATAGLYGVIQAQPLGHSSAGSLDAPSSEPVATVTATATPPPAPIAFPSHGGAGTLPATLPPAPATTEPSNVSVPVSPGELPRFNHPVTRTRAS